MSENFAGGNIANPNNTERQLLVKILNSLNGGGGGGGGSGVSQIVGGSNVSVSPSYGTGVVTISSSGSGTTTPDYIAYAGPPTQNPPALQNIVVDVNGRQWQYYNGAWN